MNKYFVKYQIKNIPLDTTFEFSTIMELDYDKLDDEYLKEQILISKPEPKNDWVIKHLITLNKL